MNTQMLRSLCAVVAASGVVALVANVSYPGVAQTTASPLPAGTNIPGGVIASPHPEHPDAPAMGQIAPADKAAPPLPTSDADFVRMAAMANTAEVSEGKLALARTKSPVVRQFAQRMVDDHATALVELRAAAKAGHRYGVPNGINPDERSSMNTLRSTSDGDFDRVYMQEQVPDHVAAVKLFQWEIDNGKDATIKDYATRQITAVKHHLDMAQAYLASRGQSTVIDAAGAALGHDIHSAPNGPNGTPGNNPATTTNGVPTSATRGSESNTTGNPPQPQSANPMGNQTSPAPQMTQPPGAGPTASPHP